jgi:hypothetical protein
MPCASSSSSSSSNTHVFLRETNFANKQLSKREEIGRDLFHHFLFVEL